MILSRVFEIKKDKWLNEQFNLSTLLYNQGRHFINEYFNQKSNINGALNILRKYLIKNAINEFSVIQKIIDRGLLFRPYRISFY